MVAQYSEPRSGHSVHKEGHPLGPKEQKGYRPKHPLRQASLVPRLHLGCASQDCPSIRKEEATRWDRCAPRPVLVRGMAPDDLSRYRPSGR